MPGVCWEGLALCCASLQAILEREVFGGTASPTAPEAGGEKLTSYLPFMMDALGKLVLQTAPSLTPEGCKTAVAPEHAAAAAAALEAAVRLCGGPWAGTGAAAICPG